MSSFQQIIDKKMWMREDSFFEVMYKALKPDTLFRTGGRT